MFFQEVSMKRKLPRQFADAPFSEIPLRQFFPTLSFASSADDWLNSINGPNGRKKVSQQFAERRITEIRVERILSTAGLGIGGDGNFFIMLNSFNRDRSEWDPHCIGHEIAHTFHFDLSETPPRQTIDSCDRRFRYSNGGRKSRGWLVEDFCDVFSLQWLYRNNQKALLEFCRFERGLRTRYSTRFIDFFVDA